MDYPRFTLPYAKNHPALLLKLRDVASITGAVSLDLGAPIFSTRLWLEAAPAVMTVPEAPVDEDGHLTFGEDNVR
jgi:hypothetical protein